MRDARILSIFGLLLASVVVLPACGDGGGTGGSGAGGSSHGGGGAGTAGSGTGASSSTQSGGGGSGTGASSSGGNNTGASGGGGPIVEASCDNHVYECGDTLDNDADGLVDWQDPDCLGPCDNTENSFYGGIPGQPGPACTVDCYWDSDSGAGNDDCYWSHQCDPNEQADPGHPEPNSKCSYDLDVNIPGTSSGCADLSQTQSDICGTVCGPLTPNGCDCFGCCELPAGSGKFIWLGSEDEATGTGSCTMADIADKTKCEPCVPVPSCYNDCGPCELCLGKGPEDLPPECTPGTGGSGGTGGTGGFGGQGGSGGFAQCPPGVQSCGLAGQAPCAVDYYCITGCCQPVPTPK